MQNLATQEVTVALSVRTGRWIEFGEGYLGRVNARKMENDRWF